MRALEPEVFDAVWGAVRALLPAAGRFHPLGCHRPRICDEVALDGSLHKAPCGGEDTGPNPTDRSKIGWKWSVASERHGVPIG